MKYFLSLCLIMSSLLTACASYEVTAENTTQKTSGDYYEIVEKHSDKARRYSGFYNTLDIEATLVTSEVAKAQLAKDVEIYQWDDKRLNEEKGKFENRLNNETEVFLSFYTPERKNDNLSKNNSVWKIFLDVGGKRYEGKATKLKLPLSELESLYPFHNRFYTPYNISFPVSVRSVEGKPMKFTITGAVGSATLNFQ
ncbi:MAG: hypothetical protein ACXVCY_02105 [Pseudobdellovibrionaceae bacterium]